MIPASFRTRVRIASVEARVGEAPLGDGPVRADEIPELRAHEVAGLLRMVVEVDAVPQRDKPVVRAAEDEKKKYDDTDDDPERYHVLMVSGA